MALIEASCDVLERPTMVGVWTGVMVFLGPIWVAFVIGVLVGWAWKPKWATMGRENLSCSILNAFDFLSRSSPSLTLINGKDMSRSSVSPSEYEDCRYLDLLVLSLAIIVLQFGFGVRYHMFSFFFTLL